MLISEALAAPGAAAAGGDQTTALIMNLLPLALILVVFYFLLIRPQQKRLKAHQEMIKNLQRGDTVVTSGGMIGKVRAIADDEVRVELAPNVEVRVVRGTIAEVRNKGQPPAANDSKPAGSGA